MIQLPFSVLDHLLPTLPIHLDLANVFFLAIRMKTLETNDYLNFLIQHLSLLRHDLLDFLLLECNSTAVH